MAVSGLSIGGAMKPAQKTPKSAGASAARKTNRSGKGFSFESEEVALFAEEAGIFESGGGLYIDRYFLEQA
ncbi:hypothetical protein AXK11_06650 [Cephaloticoccus primus]|uniref:Uncharacterized protein n=1 Tax=Cephaloticoccus primus TaxID=1548207 RepID=A0A139SLG2_9BACT|nr:hypothetical protein AXK11_06650 [Cephaloticoccus primus]